MDPYTFTQAIQLDADYNPQLYGYRDAQGRFFDTGSGMITDPNSPILEDLSNPMAPYYYRAQVPYDKALLQDAISRYYAGGGTDTVQRIPRAGTSWFDDFVSSTTDSVGNAFESVGEVIDQIPEPVAKVLEYAIPAIATIVSYGALAPYGAAAVAGNTAVQAAMRQAAQNSGNVNWGSVGSSGLSSYLGADFGPELTGLFKDTASTSLQPTLDALYNNPSILPIEETFQVNQALSPDSFQSYGDIFAGGGSAFTPISELNPAMLPTQYLESAANLADSAIYNPEAYTLQANPDLTYVPETLGYGYDTQKLLAEAMRRETGTGGFTQDSLLNTEAYPNFQVDPVLEAYSGSLPPLPETAFFQVNPALTPETDAFRVREDLRPPENYFSVNQNLAPDAYWSDPGNTISWQDVLGLAAKNAAMDTEWMHDTPSEYQQIETGTYSGVPSGSMAPTTFLLGDSSGFKPSNLDAGLAKRSRYNLGNIIQKQMGALTGPQYYS